MSASAPLDPAFLEAWEARPDAATLPEDPDAWLRGVLWRARQVPPELRDAVEAFVRAQLRGELAAAEICEALERPWSVGELEGLRPEGSALVPWAELMCARGQIEEVSARIGRALQAGQGGPALCCFAETLDDPRVGEALLARIEAARGEDPHAAASLARIFGAPAPAERLIDGLASPWTFMREAARGQLRRLGEGEVLEGWWIDPVAPVSASAESLVRQIAAGLRRECGRLREGVTLEPSMRTAVLELGRRDRERIETQLLAIYGLALREDREREALEAMARRRVPAIRDPRPGALELMAALGGPRMGAALRELASSGPRALRKTAKGLARAVADEAFVD